MERSEIPALATIECWDYAALHSSLRSLNFTYFRMNNNKSIPLIYSQKWKLRTFYCLLLMASIGILLPETIADILGVGKVIVELCAVMFFSIGIMLIIYSVRCPYCGFRLVPYAMSNCSISKWLIWLDTATICPRCGQSTANHDFINSSN